MTSTASTDWPRAYLLQVHDEAVKHGFIWIEPISATEAKSLRQRLYRIRRRSDKALAGFILPEYHLVTVGEYDAANQRLPVIYNRNPSGKALPNIVPANPDELAPVHMVHNTPTQLPPLDPDQFLENIASTDLTLDRSEVDSFVADLMESARKKAEKAKDQ